MSVCDEQTLKVDVRSHLHHTPLYFLRQGTLLDPEFSHCPGYPVFLCTKCWPFRDQPHLSDTGFWGSELQSSQSRSK